MLWPILITVLITAPILALGTWLYLRRRTLSSRTRIALLSALFLFVLISGPVIMWMWIRGGFTKDLAHTGSGGGRFLGQFPILWLMGVIGFGAQLVRLCRKKGDL